MSVGSNGEEIAKNYLVSRDYKILTQNYHSRFGEIDIIAKDNNCTVFIEVKTRSNDIFGAPLEAITKSKLSKLIKTSQFYLSELGLGNIEYRFDAVGVKFINGKTIINHIKNITL